MLAETTIDYTIPLAVFDGVPVLLATAAYLAIAAYVARSDMARGRVLAVGAVLAFIGGGSKVVWKVTIAATGRDLVYVDDVLFPLVATGLLLIAGSLRGTVPLRSTVRTGAALGFGAVALAVAVAPGAGEVLLLAVMTAATVVIAVTLVRAALAVDQRLAAVLVTLTLLAAFLLAGLARLEQTIALQWVEEISNAVAQGALLVAVLRLREGGAVLPTGGTAAVALADQTALTA